MTKPQLAKKMIHMLRQRLSETLSCPIDDIPEYSLGRATNLLQLLKGTDVYMPEYAAAMSALHAMVGDLLWKTPSEIDTAVAAAEEAEEAKPEKVVIQ